MSKKIKLYLLIIKKEYIKKMLSDKPKNIKVNPEIHFYIKDQANKEHIKEYEFIEKIFKYYMFNELKDKTLYEKDLNLLVQEYTNKILDIVQPK